MDNYKDAIKDDSVDVKNLIYKFLSRWYLFVATITIALTFAYFINKWSQQIYEVKTSILIKDEQSVLDARFTAGLGIYNNQYKITNEIGIIKSFQMTQRALERVNFSVDYFQENRFYESELYKASPFIVVIDSASLQPVNTRFDVTFISEDEFILSIKQKGIPLYDFRKKQYNGYLPDYQYSQKFKLFDKVATKAFSFTVIPNVNVNRSNFLQKKLSFQLNTIESLVRRNRAFNVYEDKSSSIITISMRGNNVSKLVDFVNALSEQYLQKGTERKNLIAENTIKFIDTQVSEISDSLNYSETLLQNYRSENKVMNMDFQSQQVMTALETLKDQHANILVKSKYYDYLRQYLNDNKNGQDLIAPSSLGIDDPILGGLISELTRLFNDRLEIQFNSKKDNPYLSSIELRINTMKKTILENIENLLNATNISLDEVNRRIDQVSERVNKLPETQRQLFGFERNFKLNDALYTYLLTKRSEMQIAKASYLPENEIIDVARDNEYITISPNTKRNFLIALFLGLGIPLAFLLVKDFLNDRIQLNEDIESITDFPILGHIIRNKNKTHTIAYDNPMCLTSESIRSIRTNFQFITNERSKHVVLVTSSMMNEGKSFVCINLALSFALNNKKCIILSFDLRKPKISEYLDIHYDAGISSFLSSDVTLDELIIPTKYPNLDVILSGPNPPNPMELLSGEKTKDLFRKLKEKYDYIFVDTPPVGMVADALILLKYSDINLYIIRHNYSLKKVFSNVVQNFRKRGINSMNLIVNDVPIGKKYLAYSQGYAYNYGYGYGNGYYSDEHKKSGKQGNGKIRKLFRNWLAKTGIWL
jgi:tyrosine-protein kinase Etk/Wzc